MVQHVFGSIISHWGVILIIEFRVRSCVRRLTIGITTMKHSNNWGGREVLCVTHIWRRFSQQKGCAFFTFMPVTLHYRPVQDGRIYGYWLVDWALHYIYTAFTCITQPIYTGSTVRYPWVCLKIKLSDGNSFVCSTKEFHGMFLFFYFSLRSYPQHNLPHLNGF